MSGDPLRQGRSLRGLSSPLVRNLGSVVVSARHGLVALCSLLAIIGLASKLSADDRAFSPIEQGELQPGDAKHFELSGKESHSFTFRIAPPDVWRVAVEQLGIDVRVQVSEVNGNVVKTVDNPLIRFGPEVLVLAPEDPGHFRVLVKPSETQPLPGAYRIEVTQLGVGRDGDPAALAFFERQVALSRAGELSAEEIPEKRREAMEIYRRAAAPSDLVLDRRLRALALASFAQLAIESGQYDQALESFREVFPIWKSLGDTILAADALSEIGLIYLDQGDTVRAREFLASSIDLHTSVSNTYGEAVARSNLCMIDLSTGEHEVARACFERVFELHEETGDLAEQAKTLLNLGGAFGLLGEPTAALERFRRARGIFKTQGDWLGEAQALNNLAWVHEGVGELQPALESYGRALDVVRVAGDRRWEARVLNNLGATYWRLGDQSRAQTLLEQAIPIRREVQDQRGEAITHTLLGQLFLAEERTEDALKSLRRALTLSREMADRRREGRVLGYLGKVHLTLDDLSAASRRFEQSLEILGAVGDRQGEGRIRLYRAQLHLRRDDLDMAARDLARALDLGRQSGHQTLESESLVELAQLVRRQGRLESAVEHAEAAIDIVEGIRSRVASPILRASLVGSLRTAYELAIDVRIEQFQETGDASFHQLAFQVGEQARARSLLDVLVESDVSFDRALSPELRRRRREAQRHLNAKAKAQSKLLAREPSPQQVAAASQEVSEALLDLERVEAEVRHQSPVTDALTRPELLSVEQVEELLDPGTLWLQFALGEERSVVWAIEPDSTSVHTLPARPVIEPLVRAFHRRLSSLVVGEESERLDDAPQALSKLLLGPVADRLQGVRRLVIVADGVLHYLPFAALPMPTVASAAHAQPLGPDLLIAQLEIVYLPSASTLVLQRRRRAFRPEVQRTLVAIADPVFDPSDRRLREAGIRPESTTTAAANSLGQWATGERFRQGKIDGFSRLPSSRREAEAIAALYAADQRTLLLDFDASRERFIEAVRGRQIIHIATHGFLNSQRPELSGLVLSQVDSTGRSLDGVLRLHDLYDLELDADLVILSGCRTALGKEIRGEGLVGLTRGFMDAGADRVMASLWSVQDRATAELMIAFHRRLADGLSATAALRAAQLEIRAQRRWKDPFFWAGFVVQGDWH